MRPHRLIPALPALLALAFLIAPAGEAPAKSRPLETGIIDYEPYSGLESQLAFERTRDAGARVVRIFVAWWAMVPEPDSSQKPAGFNAGDPADPGYAFAGIDAQVRGARAAGLEPMLLLSNAPVWAEGTEGNKPQGVRVRGTHDPSPREYALFVRAAARRYSGNFPGVPRVRLWQAWNEPNVWANLTPQFDQDLFEPVRAGSEPVAPDIYKTLLNRFAAEVRRVHRDNVVVTGGLAPFGAADSGFHRVAPMVFMRELLCMNSRNRPVRRRCARPAFDIWSHHPYTEGGPTHRAQHPDNVSLGDLPRMRRLLNAAMRADQIATKRKVKFWVTEFAWDTKPPEDRGLPLKLHARWTSEALYRMWRNGVSLVTWFKLRDNPNNGFSDAGIAQSGLYFRCDGGLACDEPKPTLTAFRFPFVAFRSGKKVDVWGRTPESDRRRVLVEQRRGGGWRRVARLRSDRHGIFQDRLRRRGRGPLRARLAGKSAATKRSLPFSLKVPKDRPAVIL